MEELKNHSKILEVGIGGNRLNKKKKKNGVIEYSSIWISDQFLESTKSIADWLESAEADIADLSKKPTDNGVSIDIGDYGVEGTFRKINLD